MRKFLLFHLFLFLCILLSGYNIGFSQTNEQVSIENAHCYPNPFDNEKEVGKIKFNLVTQKAVDNVKITIVIYDYNGKKVWTRYIEYGTLNAGSTAVIMRWGGENDIGEKVANGLYFCKIIVESGSTVYKLIKILVE